MGVSTLAWWTILAIVIIVAVAVLVLLGMSARQLLRIKRRLDAYATLPVVAAVARAQVNAARIDNALAQIAPLIATTGLSQWIRPSAVETHKRRPVCASRATS